MLTKTYTIRCDGPPGDTCSAEIAYSCPAGHVDGPGRVRHVAFEAGWRRFSGGTDACPEHVNAHVHAGSQSMDFAAAGYTNDGNGGTSVVEPPTHPARGGYRGAEL